MSLMYHEQKHLGTVPQDMLILMGHPGFILLLMKYFFF